MILFAPRHRTAGLTAMGKRVFDESPYGYDAGRQAAAEVWPPPLPVLLTDVSQAVAAALSASVGFSLLLQALGLR